MSIETVSQVAERLIKTEVFLNIGGIIQVLCEAQNEAALELASPVLDYEEAAIEAGWSNYKDEFGANCYRDSTDGQTYACANWQELCEAFNIEPYQSEVYEFWAVSDFFGRKLEEAGEKVDFDFYNLVIWARTTTGQSITMDGVIVGIAADILSK